MRKIKMKEISQIEFLDIEENLQYINIINKVIENF